MTTAAIPAWKNAHADVYSTFYPRTIAEFLESVVRPSIVKLEQDAVTLKASSDPIDAFLHRDRQDLIAESLKAFCLSLNSIWERQLRSLMAGVAREHYDDPALIKKCQHLPWNKLDALFEELRGFKLSEFKAFDELDTLQLLANVCRHGDGSSMQRLSVKCPELWVQPISPMPVMTNGTKMERFRADNLEISLELLERLSSAIQSFWNQSHYIYLESLSQKHENVIKELDRLRPIWNDNFSS